jgi:L-ribulose-5-phosphate 3-epimerase UlaE
VREVLTAKGEAIKSPPVIWYRTVRNLTHQTNDTAQLFLGTRINCAQCHQHKYDVTECFQSRMHDCPLGENGICPRSRKRLLP